MAAAHARKQAPAGSAQWVLDERRQVDDFVAQEVEEFQFSARNDVEWLNEHMADILTRSHFDVAEAFKTPGKLRGKTPRTTRKRGLEVRAPLNDIFTSNTPTRSSPLRSTPFMKKIAQFQVAEDQDDTHLAGERSPARHSVGQGKENHDSGYHGMTDDEIEQHQVRPAESQASTVHLKAPYLLSPPKPVRERSTRQKTPGRDESQDTFVSATEEGLAAAQPAVTSTEHESLAAKRSQAEDTAEPEDDVAPVRAVAQDGQQPRYSNQFSVSASTVAAMDTALEQAEQNSAGQLDAEQEASTPSSEASSEHRIVRKKSSLNFASLPAREPLAAKASIGQRASGTSHIDRSRMPGAFRDSQLGREPQDMDPRDDDALTARNVVEEQRSEIPQQTSDADAAKSFSQTSTQRLQERLAMLGQSTAPRLSKSIPSSKMSFSVNDNISAPQSQNQALQTHMNDEDDSWIAPIEDETISAQAEGVADIAASQQADVVEPTNEPSRSTRSSSHAQAQAPQLQYPELPRAQAEAPSRQPSRREEAALAAHARHQLAKDFAISSPAAGRHDGPLSASKAKLFSVFKSARGIFASSASASAQAKMNTASPCLPILKSQTSIRAVDALGPDDAEGQKGVRSNRQPAIGALGNASKDSLNLHKDLPHAPRRFSDRLKHASETVQKENEEPRPISQDSHSSSADDANATSMPQGQQAAHQHSKSNREEEMPDFPPPPPPKNQTSLLSKPGDLRRPARLTKEQPQPKGKPAPVNIRLRGFQGQGMGPFGSNRPASAAQPQESQMTAVPSKQPTLSKKTSTSSLASSAQSYKTTAPSRPKALEAAARKKEQDEREAQRKAEQKRDLERRRAAKAEEERKAEQERKAAEQRAAEEKQQALKQAAEQRKAEAIRRNEQLRAQAAATAAREKQPDEVAPSNSDRPVASYSQQSRDQAPQNASRLVSTTDSFRPAMPHVNPAKPPKRHCDADADDDRLNKGQLARSGQGQPAAKRRRTSEDSFAEVVSRPTMAPPVRPSMKRQETNTRPVQSTLNNITATQPQQPLSMMKTAVTNQHQLQHLKTPHMGELAKFSNAKIPFAEAQSASQPGSAFPPYPQTARSQSQFKTPGTAPSHTSSPQYPNGDNISLPEINTDSEDSDEENEFEPPEWAASPALRELLKQQQLVDPMKVFGPIAPLMMEEVFKGNKERQAKFRKRTSSANWAGADRLTEEERRRDQEAREKLEREGGWTMDTIKQT